MKVYRTRNRDYKVDKISEESLSKKEKALDIKIKHLKKLGENNSVPENVRAKRWKEVADAAKRLKLRRELFNGRNKKRHSNN